METRSFEIFSVHRGKICYIQSPYLYCNIISKFMVKKLPSLEPSVKDRLLSHSSKTAKIKMIAQL